MSFDPEILKKLLEIFQSELEESSNVLINGLLQLENNDNHPAARESDIEAVFRSAHNLKGAAQGLGIDSISDIAHHIESIFAKIKQSNDNIPKPTIDVCLEAVDKMQIAMQAFANKTPLPFDMNDLQLRMGACFADTEVPPPVVGPNTVQSTVELGSTTSPSKVSEVKVDKTAMAVTGESIRVSLKIIDKLSELSEEIQASKIEMDDQASHAKELSHRLQIFSDAWHDMQDVLHGFQTKEEYPRLKQSLVRVNDGFVEISSVVQKMSYDFASQAIDYSRLSKSLQGEVSSLRLVPANNYLGLLPRYIRELSTELNKKAELEITGGDVYIDKYVLESLKDPINHLLRNAIDHGIEEPHQRKRVSKNPEGKIRIHVKDAGHQVIFEISDDGSGLDYAVIKDKVQSLNPGVNEKIETLSQQQIEDYIFRPGFSTRNVVTNVSGRGVGLDVVRRNVQALKGDIKVVNNPGLGLTFIISVPLSLSSERGLLVQCDDQIYVLPTASVARVALINQSDVIHVEGGHAILVNDHPVLLKSLSSVLGFVDQHVSVQSFPVVILNSRDSSIAFVVDHIVGEREIIIKPIQEPLSSVECVSGATLLDRHKMAIVLDPDQLLQSSYQSSARYKPMEQSANNEGQTMIRILVVDDSITTRMLEKNILESEHYQVTTAVNGQDAWDILQKQSFSLVITDINMPIMDGFELTEKIKKSEKFSNLPVIIVTSLGSDAEKSRGVDVGADAYIVKNDFESGNLLRLIRRMI